MYKKISIKFLMIIIATLVFTLLIPSIKNDVNAAAYGDDNNREIIGTYYHDPGSSTLNTNRKDTFNTITTSGRDFWYTHVRADVFKNEYIYCIRLGQNLGENIQGHAYKYSLNQISIDGRNSPYLNGLALILNENNGRNCNRWEDYHNDPIQLALWAYLHEYDDSLHSINNLFDRNQAGSDAGLTINNDQQYIELNPTWGSASLRYGGNNDIGKRAWQILNRARIAARGESDTYYYAEAYILIDTNASSSRQKLVFVKTTGREEKLPPPTPSYTIIKEDFSGNKRIQGAEFAVYLSNIKSVTVNGTVIDLNNINTKESWVNYQNKGIWVYKYNYNNGITIGSKDNGLLKTNQYGGIYLTDITPANVNANMGMTIQEVNPAVGYDKLPKPLHLTWTLRDNEWQVSKSTVEDNLDDEYIKFREQNGDTTAAVILKNKNKINKLKLIKVNASDTNQKLQGAKFKITLTNVESIGHYSSGSKSGTIILTGAITDENGEIYINDLVVKDANQNVEITIEEIEAPEGFNILPTKIRIVLDKFDPNKDNMYRGYIWGQTYYGDLDYEEGQETYGQGSDKPISSWGNGPINNDDGTEVVITIFNEPNEIELSGMVWKDGQIGEKNIQSPGPDGKKDNEERGIEGVLVGLIKVSNNTIIRTTPTESDGTYIFEHIPYEASGYKIVFSYDGINWQETKSIRNVTTGGDSVASEIDRNTFNDGFKTISKGQSNDETILTYTYDNEESKLNVDMAGNTTGTTDKKFQISAQTEIYNMSTDNIDCGLVKKEVDLAIGTDVKSATLKINDKETTYNYAQIMNGELEDLNLDGILQNKSSDSDVVYNLYLYLSDYNYRIGDYITDNTGITNNVNPGNPEGGYIATNKDDNNEAIKELESYVTYSVILKNQTTRNATVDQFVYYYDSIYTPYNISSTERYDVSIDETNRKITFTSKNNEAENISKKNGLGLHDENNYRIQIDLTFKLDINSDAYKNLITTSRKAKNVVEITRYSTDVGGLIDKDSAPENANITVIDGILTVGQYEDDTDEAEGINISIKQEDSRSITGTVFDDADKDGSLNNENNPINDVIVQLIEIKKIGGKYYEYIWQETRSGSNEVKTTDRNGYTGTTYTNSVTEAGNYEFKDFIPGNYIIRFIYGDGSTYDLTDNVKTYNGQDYKSTIDENYTKAWYIETNYEAGKSIARDNESRRLEVMAYSSVINGENGADLANKNTEALEKTWMCAETSRINVPVHENSTMVSDNNITFDNMHFGLTLRPKTKLVLEKHITGLKITPSGTGVQSIVDAKADIAQIISSEDIETTGVSTGLATNKSTRGNRGFWQVATDVEELVQGAGLQVEYTYVIRNNGEEDYLSPILVNAYEGYITNEDGTRSDEKLGMTYQEYLNTLKYDTRGITEKYGTYLGQYYYNGNLEGCSKVSSRVEIFEEALNNDFAFDTEEAIDFIKYEEANNKRNVYDANGVAKEETMKTVVRNRTETTFLKTGEKDYSKSIKLATTLSTTNRGEIGANIPSYIAEIVQYSNAAGRRDMNAVPENLSYVHSNDSEITMEDNEHDEFWAESIIITKPTGEDKLTLIQIVLMVISAMAVLGVGIVLIKKFALKR